LLLFLNNAIGFANIDQRRDGNNILKCKDEAPSQTTEPRNNLNSRTKHVCTWNQTRPQ
jgi:hypothetical protein